MRTLLVRQDWASTGVLQEFPLNLVTPNVLQSTSTTRCMRCTAWKVFLHLYSASGSIVSGKLLSANQADKTYTRMIGSHPAHWRMNMIGNERQSSAGDLPTGKTILVVNALLPS